MILLQNGCSYSGLGVTPKNWDKKGASLQRDWYIYYRFYSPNCKKGKLKIIKGGLNKLKTLTERREAVKALLEAERRLLEECGYNPILNKKVIPQQSDYIISPDTGFIEALQAAYDRLEYASSTMSDLRSIIKGATSAATMIGLHSKSISEIKRRNIIALLDACSGIIKGWSPKRYNHYKAYLSILFKELVKVEAIESNPLNGIEKKAVVKTIRTVLTQAERVEIDQFLKIEKYTFWRFMHIFFHAGIRESELMKVQKEHVFLNEQYFLTTIKKGGKPIQVKKAIKGIVKPLWEEVYNEATDHQFLFTRNLKPGDKAIRADQISKRWKRHVKDKLNITADFYSLKHLSLDEVSEILSIQEAAKMASHTTTRMTETVYAVGKTERDLIKLQNLTNKFA